MGEDSRELAHFENLASVWGFDAELIFCQKCEWTYLAPKNLMTKPCPHCFHEALALIEQDSSQFPDLKPPELVMPFEIQAEAVLRGIERFAEGIRFAPADLKADQLIRRLKRVYVPAWLVDVDVQATWELEAGFDYQVVSHQDRYNEIGGGWTSQQVIEGRIRWEPRVGRLTRTYQNISAPAIEDDREIRQNLGAFDRNKAEAYQEAAIKDSFIRLPERETQDAWTDAVPEIQGVASQECLEAAGADHVRSFGWTPKYLNHNWSLLLQPIYTTYYLDDENQPQLVYVHGQSAKISGVRRASMKRAQRLALMILGAAIFMAFLSLVITAIGVVAPPLLVIGGLGLGASVFVGLGALLPLVIAWQFNRNQKGMAK